MSLAKIVAHMECDGCGRPMKIDIEHANPVPKGWSMFEVAVDTCRGGSDGTSVQGESDQCLCSKCTRIVDDANPADRNATDAEIKAALDAAAGV